MAIVAKTRRRFHMFWFLIWLGPGAVISWFARNSVPWVVFMSWWAAAYAPLSAYAAETPVEEEDA